MTDNYDNIPQILTRHQRWTIFEVVGTKPDGKMDKVIRKPDGSQVTKGFEITKNMGRFGDVIDLCRKNPKFFPGYHIEKDVHLLFGDADGVDGCPDYPTYTERSMSPKSYHMLAWYEGDTVPILPDFEETYIDGRWVVLTGDIVDDKKDILYIDETLDKKENVTYKKKGESHKLEEGKEIWSKGERYNHIFAGARSDFCRNRPFDMALAAAMVFNKKHCSPICSDDYVEKAVKDAYNTPDSKEWIVEKITRENEKVDNQEFINSLVNNKVTPSKPNGPLLFDKDLEAEAQEDNIRADQLAALCYFDKGNLPKWCGCNHPILKEWNRIAEDISYSRPSYHFASLISLMSPAIARRACVELGLLRVYPNIYSGCIGITTISGKSYSTTICNDQFMDAVVEVKALNNNNKILKLSQTISNAALCQEMTYKHIAYWYFNEAREFFVDGEKWNAPIISNMANAYDGGPIIRKLSDRNRNNKKGEKEEPEEIGCEQPFLTWLFNMTITQLKDSCTGKLFTSGFAPRIMWFIETDGKMARNKTLTTEQKEEVKNMREKINRISNKIFPLGENSIIFNVSEKIEDWKIVKSEENISSEEHQTVIGRGFVQIYKLATIFTMFDEEWLDDVLNNNPCLKETDPKKKRAVHKDLPDKWVDEAIRIYNIYLYQRMIMVMNMAKEEDKTNKQTYLLEKLKELKGVATRSKLMNATRYNGKEFDTSMEALEQSGLVRTLLKRGHGKDGKLSSGPKTAYYYLIPEDKIEESQKNVDSL